MDFCYLPTDCWIEIIYYFDPHDCVVLKSVCSFFSELIPRICNPVMDKFIKKLWWETYKSMMVGSHYRLKYGEVIFSQRVDLVFVYDPEWIVYNLPPNYGEDVLVILGHNNKYWITPISFPRDLEWGRFWSGIICHSKANIIYVDVEDRFCARDYLVEEGIESFIEEVFWCYVDKPVPGEIDLAAKSIYLVWPEEDEDSESTFDFSWLDEDGDEPVSPDHQTDI